MHGTSVVGPDGYAFKLRDRPAGRREPFRAVHFEVADPKATAAWYAKTLGMAVAPHGTGERVYFAAAEAESFQKFQYWCKRSPGNAASRPGRPKHAAASRETRACARRQPLGSGGLQVRHGATISVFRAMA